LRIALLGSLVTDKPVAGVDSIDTTKGAELCWG